MTRLILLPSHSSNLYYLKTHLVAMIAGIMDFNIMDRLPKTQLVASKMFGFMFV